jgi:hypothetical protein
MIPKAHNTDAYSMVNLTMTSLHLLLEMKTDNYRIKIGELGIESACRP